MGYAVLIIGLLAIVGSIVYQVLTVRKVEHSKKSKISKKSFKTLSLCVIATALGAVIANIGLAIINKWWTKTAYPDGLFEGDSISFVLQAILMFGGALLLAASINTLVLGFRFRYYKTNIDPEYRKLVSKIMFISIPVVVVSFLIWSNGIGPYLAYPLISGFGIDDAGFHFTATSSGIVWQPEWADGIRGPNDYQYGGFKIAFYALFILLGFGVCYWIADHNIYKKYGKHGEADVIAILAFLAGILGARIWYVVGNWSREFAGQPWYSMFQIWNGGLTILGGAFGGFIVGYLLVVFLRPHWDIRWVVDLAVPTILLAQAIGRIGNFTNIEVYGGLVDINAGGLWKFLPNWLLMQMNFTPSAQSLGYGMIHVPLWFVEAMINLTGYFLIRFAVGKGLKKFLVTGDLGGCYFVWYGIVRFILEPLRDSNYNMGTDNSWSICNSMAYIFIGVSIIILFHVHDWVENRGEDTKKFIFPIAGGLTLLSLLLPLVQSMTISESTGTFTAYQGYDMMFNKGATVALVGVVVIGLAGIALIVSGFLNGNVSKIVVLSSIGLTALGTILFFMSNRGINFVPDGYDTTNITYNLSYGYVLVSLANILSLAGSIGYAWGMYFKKKNKVVEAPAMEDANV